MRINNIWFEKVLQLKMTNKKWSQVKPPKKQGIIRKSIIVGITFN